METRRHGFAETASAERLRRLSRRCRDVSDMTAVPEMSRELIRIADDLDDEAAVVERDLLERE